MSNTTVVRKRHVSRTQTQDSPTITLSYTYETKKHTNTKTSQTEIQWFKSLFKTLRPLVKWQYKQVVSSMHSLWSDVLMTRFIKIVVFPSIEIHKVINLECCKSSSHRATNWNNVNSFIHSFIRSFVRSFVRSYIHSLIHSLCRSISNATIWQRHTALPSQTNASAATFDRFLINASSHDDEYAVSEALDIKLYACMRVCRENAVASASSVLSS